MKGNTAAIIGMLERLPTPIVLANPITAEVLWVNSRLVKLAEFSSANQLIGTSLFDYIQPDQVGKALADLAKVALKKSPPPFTYHLRKASGEFAAVQVGSTPILYAGELAMLSVVTDVSDRERLLRGLEESEERYRVLLENLPIAVTVVAEQRFVYANSAMLDVCGAQAAGEVVGRSIYEFVSEQDQPKVRQARRQVLLDGGPPREGRVTIRKADGSELEVYASISRVLWEGMLATQTVLRAVSDE